MLSTNGIYNNPVEEKEPINKFEVNNFVDQLLEDIEPTLPAASSLKLYEPIFRQGMKDLTTND